MFDTGKIAMGKNVEKAGKIIPIQAILTTMNESTMESNLNGLLRHFLQSITVIPFHQLLNVTLLC